MKANILVIGLLFLSCNSTNKPGLSENLKDSIVNNSDSLPEMSIPVVFSTGVADTIISFSVEGISSEGSEIKAHYINDTIAKAQWHIFGETGKTAIEYIFLKNGNIQAIERQYLYKVSMPEVKSLNDIILKDTISYLLDANGIVKTVIEKDFTDVYPEFRANVPLVLKRSP